MFFFTNNNIFLAINKLNPQPIPFFHYIIHRNCVTVFSITVSTKIPEIIF